MRRVPDRAWLRCAHALWVCAAATVAQAEGASDATGREHARADTDTPVLLVGSQRLGAGHDTNPALSPPPEVRRANADAAAIEDPGGRALAGGEASLGAFVGDPWWAGLTLDLDGRWYFPGSDHEGRLDSVLGVKGGWDGPAASVALTIEGERYDASFGTDAAWSGRTGLRGVWKAVGHWQLGAQVGGGLRAYDTGGAPDRNVSGGLDLAYRAPHGHALVGFDLGRRDSDVATAIRTELAPRVAAGVVLGQWSIDAQYTLLARWFDAPNQNEVEHVVRLDAVWWLASWIGPFARGEVGLARGEADAFPYDRFAVLGGLAARFGSAPSPREVRSRALARQGPAALVHDRVRFRFFLPGAEHASLIGTFNGWDADAGRLTPVGGGWFESVRAVEPGRHRYHLVVDGRPVKPTGAPAYAPDDFGGQDAVLVVPAANEAD